MSFVVDGGEEKLYEYLKKSEAMYIVEVLKYWKMLKMFQKLKMLEKCWWVSRLKLRAIIEKALANGRLIAEIRTDTAGKGSSVNVENESKGQ